MFVMQNRGLLDICEWTAESLAVFTSVRKTSAEPHAVGGSWCRLLGGSEVSVGVKTQFRNAAIADAGGDSGGNLPR